MSKMKKIDKKYSLEIGEKDFARNPIVSLVPDGKLTYIWIGNNAEDDMRCFGTLDGKYLRELALKILDAFQQGG